MPVLSSGFRLVLFILRAGPSGLTGLLHYITLHYVSNNIDTAGPSDSPLSMSIGAQ